VSGLRSRVSRMARVTAKRFHERVGLDEWHVLFWGAYSHYRLPSFSAGAAFVSAVAETAERLGHAPDVDLRPDGATVRVFSAPDGSLSDDDVELASAIGAIAREHGLEPDAGPLQVVGIAVAEGAGVDTRPFWMAALGYVPLGDEDAIDPQRRNAHAWFHPVSGGRTGRGRTHIDVSVPADQVQARVQAAVAAGGRIVDDSAAPRWYTIASPDNHGVDIAGWPDVEDGEEG
jgi:4a-hydroxytetrahydrobiopterin dehydratase